MKDKLIYFTPSLSSFSKKDIEILSEKYDVRIFVFSSKKKIYTPLQFLHQFIFLIWNIKCRIYFSQFGGYHTLLPGIFSRLYKKKSYIVTGGTDCVSFPNMSYGNFSKSVLGKATCLSYRLTDVIFPVHQSLILAQNNYDPEQKGSQGFLTFCKNIRASIHVIHNGYDPVEWGLQNTERIPQSFITVSAGASDLKRFKLKGLDLFCESARLFPDSIFTIVGTTRFEFNYSIPENVRMIDFADQSTLQILFNSHQFYMQLSISEGFPNAICEAMLCGCIPIASSVAALPEIVGDTGYILAERNISLLEALIKRAIDSNEKNLAACRNHISSNFHINMRKHNLFNKMTIS